MTDNNIIGTAKYRVISEKWKNSNEQNNKIANIKTAVFVHLHYTENINKYCDYLNCIPSETDLYISYSNSTVYEKMKKLITRKEVTYVCKENRGRDVSALLVALREYVLRYEVFCFIHDKKSKENETKGETVEWVKLLWECCLGGTNYINNVIDSFYSDDELGVLFPPPLVTKNFGRIFENSWGTDFENTCKLANRLNINEQIDSKKAPMALGTCFWARRDAIKRIFDVHWKYEDFDDEPLPIDGTISHAIERIFQYIALDSGYAVSYLIKDTYCEEYLENMDVFSTKVSNVLSSFGIYNSVLVNGWDAGLMKLQSFTKKHKRIFCYGAGKRSGVITSMLKLVDRIPDAYLVTDMSNSQTEHNEKVLLFDELDIEDMDGFIIGTSPYFYAEIEDRLLKAGVKSSNILKLF